MGLNLSCEFVSIDCCVEGGICESNVEKDEKLDRELVSSGNKLLKEEREEFPVDVKGVVVDVDLLLFLIDVHAEYVLLFGGSVWK